MEEKTPYIKEGVAWDYSIPLFSNIIICIFTYHESDKSGQDLSKRIAIFERYF